MNTMKNCTITTFIIIFWIKDHPPLQIHGPDKHIFRESLIDDSITITMLLQFCQQWISQYRPVQKYRVEVMKYLFINLSWLWHLGWQPWLMAAMVRGRRDWQQLAKCYNDNIIPFDCFMHSWMTFLRFKRSLFPLIIQLGLQRTIELSHISICGK